MRIRLHKLLLLLHDVLVILFAIFLSNVVYENYNSYFELDNISGDLLMGYLIMTGTLLLAMSELEMYKYQVILNRLRHAMALQKALFISLVALVFFSFLFKFADVSSSRVLLGLIYINTSLLLLITRVLIVPNIFYRLVSSKVINRNLLIVGTGQLSTNQAEELIENRSSYFNIVGLVTDGSSLVDQKEIQGVNVLGDIDNIEQVVEQYQVNDILVASDTSCDNKLHDIIEQCKSSNRTIHIVSELYNIAQRKIKIEEIGKVSAFRYVPAQPGTRLVYPIMKRIVDVSISLMVIIGLLPIWLTLAFLIKVGSRGPVFYKARAVGKNGEEFKMYKFRSMRVDASTKLHEDKVRKMILENSATKKLTNDPRITHIGRILRKLSVDEFPQLINVIKGEMSLVGPRPCLPYEYEVMKDWQKQRFAITPGMTGIWQIKGRDEVLFNEQVILDLYYKEHCSVWMDLQILFGTIPVVIFGRGGA